MSTTSWSVAHYDLAFRRMMRILRVARRKSPAGTRIAVERYRRMMFYLHQRMTRPTRFFA